MLRCTLYDASARPHDSFCMAPLLVGCIFFAGLATVHTFCNTFFFSAYLFSVVIRTDFGFTRVGKQTRTANRTLLQHNKPVVVGVCVCVCVLLLNMPSFDDPI